MKYLPVRKPNRLKGYDYSQVGKYFLTICAKDRLELFATIEAASCRPQYTHIGNVIEDEIATLSNSYPGVSVEFFVIMPNHIHMIIDIIAADGGRRNAENRGRQDAENRRRQDAEICGRQDAENRRRQDAAPTVSQMINQWKRAVSIKIGYSVWQKSFHDHIIRNESEYRKIVEYIKNNPIRWKQDCFYHKN